MSPVFDYEYKRNIHGLPEGFVYRSVADATYIFGDDVKLHDFLRLAILEMKGYAEMYRVNKIKALPYINVNTNKGIKLIGFDYYFFIQCVCRYLVRIADKESAIAFERDFLIGADKGLNRNKAVMLFYMYFQLAADLTYASSLGKKATVGYVNYSLETVYKYNDKSIEMHLISFNLEKLSNYINDEKMMQGLESLGSIFEAEQVAFGGFACMEYWKKSKLKPHYFLARDNIIF